MTGGRLQVMRRSLRSLLFSKEAGMAIQGFKSCVARSARFCSRRKLGWRGRLRVSGRSLRSLLSRRLASFLGAVCACGCVRLRAAACVVCVVRSFWIGRTRAIPPLSRHARCAVYGCHAGRCRCMRVTHALRSVRCALCTRSARGMLTALAHGSPSASHCTSGSLGARNAHGSRACLFSASRRIGGSLGTEHLRLYQS